MEQNPAYRLPENFYEDVISVKQQSLKQSINLKGTGLHSGCEVSLKILPAPAEHGIVFRRVDLPHKPEIKALYYNVTDTRNCTCLSNEGGAVVSTIEHLMAVLCMAGIDNALIEVDNQELPIMDGSAKVFWDVLKDAEVVEQKAERRILKILKKISFTDDKGNTAALLPVEHEGLSISFGIDFPSPVVGHQTFDAMITPQIFAGQIAPSRTFCEKSQVDYLRSVGLIKGGSLENAVVLDGDKILNPEGFRNKNECVCHKVLDAIGDLYTSGCHIQGRLVAEKTGHYHNNVLLKKLFEDSTQYELL